MRDGLHLLARIIVRAHLRRRTLFETSIPDPQRRIAPINACTDCCIIGSVSNDSSLFVALVQYGPEDDRDHLPSG